MTNKELVEKNIVFETPKDRGCTQILQAMKMPRNVKQKVKEEQRTERDNKPTVLDTQYLFPKFYSISGEKFKQKTEATYEEWEYEVNCT